MIYHEQEEEDKMMMKKERTALHAWISSLFLHYRFIYPCTTSNVLSLREHGFVLPRYKQMKNGYWFGVKKTARERERKEFLMDHRRFTMTNPTAVFSIVAHEAWDQKICDKDNDDNGHNISQRSRRRYTVSIKGILSYLRVVLFIDQQIFLVVEWW